MSKTISSSHTKTRTYFSEIEQANIRIVVEYGWSLIETNTSPYFFVTGEVYRGGVRIALGVISDYIEEAMPELTDIQAMRISNAITGEPLWAKENSFYWYTSNHPSRISAVPADWLDLSPAERAANYLRCDADLFDNVYGKQAFNDVVDSLFPAWKAEAEAVIKKHELDTPITAAELAARSAE